jgi:MSHA biogenesis protein MshQ
MKIANAYGSERLPLPMTVAAQYWNGTTWVTNVADSLTSFNGGIYSATSPLGNVVAADVPGLSLANHCTFASSIASVPPINAGVGSFILVLAAPGVACSANMSINAPSYLPTLPAPGRATFGIYKSPLIYRRENY